MWKDLRADRILRICALFICLLLPVYFVAQSTQVRQIAQGISKYRSYLLEKKPESRIQLGVVLRKLDKLGLNDEESSELTTFIGFLSQPDSLVNPSHLSFMIEQLRSRTYFDSLSDTELNVLADNADLYDLVNLDVLELDYPYIVKPGLSLHHELFFYDIQSGDRIAEIGAGNGEFSIVLTAIYDSLVLYINELDHYRVKYITQKVEKLNSLLDPSEVLVVQGGITRSGLEDDSVDKIILRNTYHHFTEKKFMLASLHAALTEGGLLFLYEATHDLNKKDMCRSAMKEKDIVKLISKSGFNYLDRKVVDKVVLLKFSVQ